MAQAGKYNDYLFEPAPTRTIAAGRIVLGPRTCDAALLPSGAPIAAPRVASVCTFRGLDAPCTTQLECESLREEGVGVDNVRKGV
jgi:hypothetical protein